LRGPKKRGFDRKSEGEEKMDTQWLFEEKHTQLKNELSDKLQKKVSLELEISKQFEQLKRSEITIEKTSSHCTQKEQRRVH
jgi:hypothetical protein